MYSRELDMCRRVAVEAGKMALRFSRMSLEELRVEDKGGQGPVSVADKTINGKSSSAPQPLRDPN